METGSAPRVPFPLVDKPSKFMVDSQVDGVLGVGFQQKPSLIPPFFGLLTLALGTPVYTYHMEKLVHCIVFNTCIGVYLTVSI